MPENQPVNAEKDVCDGCQKRPCVCETVVLPSAEKDLRHKPFGLTHPTWDQPSCFYYATENEAWEAIGEVYGEGSGHLVVGVLTRPIPPGLREVGE